MSNAWGRQHEIVEVSQAATALKACEGK